MVCHARTLARRSVDVDSTIPAHRRQGAARGSASPRRKARRVPEQAPRDVPIRSAREPDGSVQPLLAPAQSARPDAAATEPAPCGRSSLAHVSVRGPRRHRGTTRLQWPLGEVRNQPSQAPAPAAPLQGCLRIQAILRPSLEAGKSRSEATYAEKMTPLVPCPTDWVPVAESHIM